MAIAPNFALWAFVSGSIGLLSAALMWLVLPEWLAAVVRRLWLADAIAAWLAFAWAYHARWIAPGALAWADPAALWTLGAALGAWLALRVLPGPWRRPTVLLALALFTWGGLIGAGFQFIERMEAEQERLELAPETVLAAEPVAYVPLARARRFSRMDRDMRALLDQVLGKLERGIPLDVGVRLLAKLELIPQLLTHYDLELRRQQTYQWFQIGLLAIVLAAWGFGETLRNRE
ncbi:MAG: hypothetical protein IIA41_07200 [SAR324 cluster bacterium]|nr:hypothetical protein [SAR324 cluster bacterium]